MLSYIIIGRIGLNSSAFPRWKMHNTLATMLYKINMESSARL